MSNATLLQSDLHSFTGDDIRYQHPLNRHVIYTPGVRYLAEKAHAFWLVDAIASYFGSCEMENALTQDHRIKSLQFWRLEVNDSKARLTARADDDIPPFICQQIEFTDFPLEQIDIWAGYDGSQWTLYLPSEH